MRLHVAYLAGLFDGEGWVSIKRNTTYYRRATFTPTAEMTVREGWLLERVQAQFGGTVREQRSRSDEHSTYFKWHLSGTRQLIPFLEAVIPFLLLKQAQATLALDLAVRQNGGSNRPISDDEWQWRERAYLRMRELNRKGRDKAVRQLPGVML